MRMWRIVMMVVVVLALVGGVLPHARAAEVDSPPADIQAQSTNVATWEAEFYNNSYLLGSPDYETLYTGLELFWGEASPNEAVQADDFSARFGADPYFTAGTYRFYVQADDEVKIKVGSVVWEPEQLNTFGRGQPGQLLTFDVELQAGVQHIQIDYRELVGEAYLYFDWVNMASGASAPSFPIPVRVTLSNPWTVQYFGNTALSGAPILAQTENEGPTRNWGDGAPATGVPADNFSIRFVSFQTLNPGTYELAVEADDGVRVYVNGQLLIDQWHGATGQTYTAPYNHAGGDVTFTIEYYDATSAAHLSFGVNVPPQTPAAAPTTPLSGPTATVLAWRLNVRDVPNTTNSTVLVKIDQGETYPVVGANADESWWQIDVNGTVGWVSATWVRIDAQAPVPTAASSVPNATGYTLTARNNANMRALPNDGAAIVAVVPYQQTASIVGRTANNSWWQIQYGTTTGWVNTLDVVLQANINLDFIPVTG